MSIPTKPVAHPLAPLRLGAALAVVLLGGTGCWEQWSVEWWPQMKFQNAVQAFEETGHPDPNWTPDPEGGDNQEAPYVIFLPPEGSVPVGAPLDLRALTLAETEALANPTPPTLASLDNGKEQYEIFCAVCHGKTGAGDGPVAGPPFGKGPFIGVLPIGGQFSAAKVFTDGHIFTTITNGRGRMPSYKRIPAADRWDIVNYVRYLNDQVGPRSAAAEGGAQ